MAGESPSLESIPVYVPTAGNPHAIFSLFHPLAWSHPVRFSLLFHETITVCFTPCVVHNTARRATVTTKRHSRES